MAKLDFSYISNEFLNNGPIVIFVWKNQEGWSVEAVTHNIEKLYGYDPNLYINGSLKYSDQIHPDDLPRVYQEVINASSNPLTASFVHEPYRYLTAHGYYHWVKDSTQIHRDGEGNITHYIGYLADVNEEMLLLEENKLNKSKYENVLVLQRAIFV